MPRKPGISTFRRHATGQGFVEVKGRRIYLGRCDLPETRERYDRLIAEWLSNGRRLPDWVNQRSSASKDESGPLLVTLIARYWEHVKSSYTRDDGQPSTIISDVKQALRPLRERYGRTPAAEFGPRRLSVVRDVMVATGWNRITVNKRTGMIVRMFKWGSSQELVPVNVWQALTTLEGLKKGRSDAPEPSKIGPLHST